MFFLDSETSIIAMNKNDAVSTGIITSAEFDAYYENFCQSGTYTGQVQMVSVELTHTLIYSTM